MKVDIPLPTQKAEQGYVEGVVNALLMNATWKETHGTGKYQGVVRNRFLRQTL